jgi:serine phosphatase RsbU (regulator of sigma subunit)
MDLLKGRKLVVLTTPGQRIRPVLVQLWESGLDCISVETTDDVIKLLDQEVPDFVMLPFDFPDINSLSALVDKIKSDVTSEVIGYIERDSFALVNRLTGSGLKYIFLPPLTAAFMERQFRKIVRENPIKYIRNPSAQVNYVPAPSEPAIGRGPVPVAEPPLDFLELLEEKLQLTLEEVCKSTSQMPSKGLRSANQLNVVPVFNDQATAHRGVLIFTNAADGDSASFNQGLRQGICDRLLLHLKNEGRILRVGKFSKIEVDEFDFMSWSLNHCQLVKTAYHAGEEIGVAFLRKPDLGLPLTFNPQINLYDAPIGDFEKGVVLPFEVFTKLGGKGFLIGDRGGVLKGKQLETLRRKGITSLQIKDESVDLFYQHSVENLVLKSVCKFNYAILDREVRKLINISQDQQRMKAELSGASDLQTFLFPKEHFLTNEVEVRGASLRASECGGDWWYYSLVGNHIYFWIGDATGHGVSSALVAAAARSASSLLNSFPDLAPAQIMALFNNAIHAAGGSKVLMTFFLACLDLNDGKMKFVNASHTCPLLFSNRETVFSRANLQLIDSEVGPRLGEDPDSVYLESEIQLTPGDRLIFFTDGVIEIENQEGSIWGERNFLKTLIQGVNENSGIASPMTMLSRSLERFRQGTPLIDDVTYFMVQYRPGARRVKG